MIDNDNNTASLIVLSANINGWVYVEFYTGIHQKFANFFNVLEVSDAHHVCVYLIKKQTNKKPSNIVK